MAKKRTKKRTHAAANPNAKNGAPVSAGKIDKNDPKSMVIRIGAGEVGSSISQLATDVRKVMEPGTASRLKERKANKLRDYVTMCGPLGVTHLLLFSRSSSGNTNLRVATTPQGPTLNFRVEKYSLARDVKRAQKHPLGGGKEYITPPLLVMNSLTSEPGKGSEKIPRHLETLVTSVFHGLFPPINPQVAPLKSIRRVLLLNRERSPEDDGSYILNFRHYAITTKVTGVSKAVKRLNAAERLMNSKSRKGRLPNLSKLQDIADYMIGGENGDGYTTDATSGSEVDTDAEVEVLEADKRKKVAARRAAAAAAAAEEEDEEEEDEAAESNDRVERRAVKLVELGPRMKLRLTKVEEGLCGGKVMWHEYINKSKEEIQELEKIWEKRRQEKEARRKEQRENVEKKRKAKRGQKGGKDGEEEGDDDDMDLDDYGSDVYDYMDDEDGFDSEGLEGDAEARTNEQAEENGDWEDEEEEIANAHR